MKIKVYYKGLLIVSKADFVAQWFFLHILWLHGNQNLFNERRSVNVQKLAVEIDGLNMFE